MKPPMIFAIIALTTIVIVSSFGIQLLPVAPVQVPASAIGHELYVCPAADLTWDAIAIALRPTMRYLTLAFFFATMILLFNWGWAMYQNLLADKFDQKKFSNPWKFTKFVFWVAVVVAIVAATPNHFKTVHIRGAEGNWVLCERDTPGAAAVRANAVKL